MHNATDSNPLTPGARHHRSSRAGLLMTVVLVWLLAGCGTPFATVPDGAGRPVMLLGHDPVAYFTRGAPQHVVDLPERSYYFANAENRALFVTAPARYEPQYGGFCASGATNSPTA